MITAQFKEYLVSLDSHPSKVTIKNYVADVNKFIRWTENKFGNNFEISESNSSLIDSFKEDSLKDYSASSVERSLSSLRKFFHFLKMEGQIVHSPFEQISNSLQALAKEDPWRLKDFKNHLYVFNASHLTIKNYIIDVKQFLNWAQEVLKDSESWQLSQGEIFSNINSGLIEEYKERLLAEGRLSPVSVNRKLSSLRKYMSWATEEGLVREPAEVSNLQFPPASPSEAGRAIYPADSFQSGSRTNEIRRDNQSNNETIEQSSQDHQSYSSFPPRRLIQKTINGTVGLFDSLFIYPIAALLDKSDEAFWSLRGRPVFTKRFTPIKNLRISADRNPLESILNIPKSFYAPALISTKNFPLHRKIWHHARNTRPNWYKKYHSYAFVSYLHFSILMLFISILGYVAFDYFKPERQPATLAALPSAPPRVLSFQGRLTDASDNPITSQTSLRMAIYNNATSTGSALLWQEVVSPTPDQDGIFNVLLGKNTAIPQSLFAQNSALWLGVTVGKTSELTPRQQIATVAFAVNAETLQGLPPITNSTGTTNVVLALNSSGNLSIGGTASPTFQATGGTFTLSGQSLVLTTNASGSGNIVLKPDGTGTIDLQKPIQNTSNNNSLVPGAVEVDDLFAILGSSGSQAILNIRQNGNGDLIIASVSATTKFRVDNGGNLTAAGTINGLTVSSGTITSGTWNATAISSTYGGTGLNTSSSTGVPFISSGTWSIDPVYLGANHGGTGQVSYSTGDILYATSSSGLARLPVGTASQCLIGGSTPSWGSCLSGTSGAWWTQAGGALYADNTTVDFLIGGQSTGSAKFSIINVNSGTPTASVSSGLSGTSVFLTADGTLATQNRMSLTIGNSSTYDTTGNVLINPNGTGNVGIGTTSLATGVKLDVRGSIAAGTTISGTSAVNDVITLTRDTDVPVLVLNRNSSSSYQSQISFRQQSGPSAANEKWAIGVDSNGNNTNDMYFYSGVAPTGVKMTILSSGNVGIGTTTPISELHVTRPLSFGATGKALAIFDQIESQDILTASSGGTTRFILSNGGNLSTAGVIQGGGTTAVAYNRLGTETATGANIGDSSDLFVSNSFQVLDRLYATFLDGLSSTVNVQNGVWDFGSGARLGISTTCGSCWPLQITSTVSGNNVGGTLIQPILNTTGAGQTQYGQKISITNSPTNANTLYGQSIGFTDSGTLANTVYGLYVDSSTANANDTTYAAAFMNGNVGIGTTAPGAKLEITGNLLFTKEVARIISVADSTTANTVGGALSIIGAAGAATNAAGGAISVTAGLGAGTGNGGALTLVAGTSGNSTTSTGGAASLKGGPAGNSGAGGSLTLAGGDAGVLGDAGNGGAVTITGGSGSGGNNTSGGAITITSGAQGAGTLGGSGAVTIATANNTGSGGTPGGTTATGAIIIQTGTGFNSTGNPGGLSGALTIRTQAGGTTDTSTGGAAGALSITGGAGGAASSTGTGGAGAGITLTAGAGGVSTSGTGGAGGSLSLVAGNAGSGGNVNGGTLTLNSGAVTGSGTSTLNLGTSNATTVNLATATSATTLNIGAASTTAVTIALAGGSSDTGCTINGSTGNLTCTGNILGSSTGTQGYWQRASGALTPTNITDDLLLGAVATTSSKFAFLNVAGGTPTASVSSGLSGTSVFLTADGTLATQNRMSLTIGNSSTYDTTGNVLINPNGTGNVGIGTATPSENLVVAGASGLNIKAKIKSIDGSSAYLVLGSGHATTPDWNLISAGDTGNFFIYDNGVSNARLTIQQNGNVGIGTTAPGTRLEVSSALVDIITSPNAFFTDTTSMAAGVGGGISFKGAYTGTTLTTGAGIKTLKSNGTDGNYNFDLAFYTRLHGSGSLSERMRIDSSGNVGIGDTGPDAFLDIAGTTEQLRLAYENTDTNYISFTVGSSGDLTLNPSGGDIIFADADVLNIGGSGSDTAYNLIGDTTTGVDSSLNSDDDLLVEGNLQVIGNLIAPSSGISGFWQRASGALAPTNITDDILIGATSTASAKFAFTGLSSPLNQTQASFSGKLIVMPNNGYGNVGIGTTNPTTAKLVISGTGTETGLDLASTDQYARLRVISAIGGTPDTSLYLGYNQPAGSKTYLYGQGTTPQLTVEGSTGAIILSSNSTIYGGSAANDDITIEGTSNGTKTTSYVILQPTTGNVGIGDTGPDRKLTVFSDATSGQSQLRVGFNDSFYWDIGRDNQTTGRLFFADQGGEKLSILNSGNVGIGTTGPDQKLDVLSGAGGTQLRLTSTDGSVYTDFKTNQEGDLGITPSGGDATISATLRGTSTITADTAFRGPNGSLTIPTYGFTNFTNTGMYTNGNGSVIFAENGTDRAIIDGNGLILVNGQIRASDGNEFFKFTNAGSAVNELTLANAATGGIVTLAATGGDTDVEFSIDSKGADALNLNNNATGDVLLAGGSGTTGCTIANSTGNLTCSGAISTTATTGTQGWWTRTAGNLYPATTNDTISATTSASVALTLTQTGAFNSLLVQDEASDTTPFVIDQSGNVGIGTTAPGNILEVVTSGSNSGISVNSNNANLGQAQLKLIAGNGATSRASRIDFLNVPASATVPRWTLINDYNQNGTNDLSLVNAAGTYSVLTVLQSGNVGIGLTSNIDSILSINANSGNTSAAGGISLLGSNQDYGSRMTVYDTGTGIQAQFLLKIGGTYQTPAMVIGGAGGGQNVGIGTTGPTALLDVAGAASVGGQFTFRSGTAQIQSTARQTLSLGGTTTGLINVLDSAGSAFTTFDTVNSRVGIGTTSPGQKLHVYNSTGDVFGRIEALENQKVAGLELKGAYAGSDATSKITFDYFGTQGDGGHGLNYFSGRSGIGHHWFRDSAGTTIAVFKEGGLVGIGNTSPLTALDVTGSASLSANLSLRGAATAHTFNILDNGTLNIQRSPGGDAGLATALFIQNNGNVGIGTATVAYNVQGANERMLTIEDSVNNNGAGLELVRNTSTSGWGNGEISWINTHNSAGNQGIGYIQVLTDGTSTNKGGIFQIATKTSGTSGTPLERMRIEDNGLLGLGIETPISELHVSRPLSFGATGKALAIFDQIENQDIFTASASGTTKFSITNAGNLIPGADNTMSIGSSPSARFKDIFLGSGSVHIQCTTGDGCGGSGLDYALGVNTSTGTFSIGVNGTSAVGNPLLNITQGGNVGIGTTAPGTKLDVVGTVTWTGGNSSHLGTGVAVTTYVGNSSVNNALVRSNSNTEDAWVMNWGDSAIWGIYNRNIDSTLVVAGALDVPANSTAFIGNGLAKAYIEHGSGNAGFAGTLAVGGTVTGGTYNGQTISSAANFTGTITTPGYVSITGVQDTSGNLRFSAANPYISASSYFVAPGGAYFNSGTVYVQNAIELRGNVEDDGGNLTLADTVDITGGNLNVVNADIYTYRTGGTTGVIFLNSAGTRYLYFDGTNYIMPSSNVVANGATLISDGNTNWDNSYGYITDGNTNWDNSYGYIGTTNTALEMRWDGGTPFIDFSNDASSDFDGRLILTGDDTLEFAGANMQFTGSGTHRFWGNLTIDGTCTSQGSDCAVDYAEFYPSSESIEKAELVVADPNNKETVKKSTVPYENGIIGITSTDPGFLLSDKGAQTGKNQEYNPIKPNVALAGRVPLKVSIENGQIKIGDPLTSSSIPGVAMKATKAGQVVGKAMENYDSEGVDKIIAFVNVSWYDPDVQLTDSGVLSLGPNADGDFEVQREGRSIDRVGAFGDLVVARVKAGYLETGRITTQTILAVSANFSELSTNSLAVVTENFSIAGQNIRDYIYSIVNDAISNSQFSISNENLNAQNIKTDIISPLSDESNLALKFENNKLSIVNGKSATAAAVAVFDAEGNATFSGQISANQASISGNLDASEASISGTLRASRIVADQLELSEEALLSLLGLEEESSPPATYITNNYYASPSASPFDYDPNASSSANGQWLMVNGQLATGSASFNSLFAKTATFEQGLMSFGPTSFFEASIADRLFVGAQLSIADNAINVLGSNLQIQPLKQGGVSFVAGLVEIDKDGNLKVDGNAYFAKDLEVKGNLLANIISPLADQDLVFELGSKNQEPGSEQNRDSSFIIHNSSRSGVLSINSQGDLSASGAGTFNKLNLNVVGEALAISDIEVIATGSAGTAQIKPNRTELTIRNPLVTKDSLIYVTPKTSVLNQNVYLIRQVPNESFTVGLSQSVNKKVPFNWILIN